MRALRVGQPESYLPMKTELIERARRIVDDNQLFINIVSKRVQQINHGADPYDALGREEPKA